MITSVRTTDFRVKLWTRNLTIITQNWYPLARDFDKLGSIPDRSGDIYLIISVFRPPWGPPRPRKHRNKDMYLNSQVWARLRFRMHKALSTRPPCTVYKQIDRCTGSESIAVKIHAVVWKWDNSHPLCILACHFPTVIHFNPEHGEGTFLRSAGAHLLAYTVSQAMKPQFKVSMLIWSF
jgi:hypothetical protein